MSPNQDRRFSHAECIPGLFMGHDPTRESGQGGFNISRVGSGPILTFYNLTGRIGSGQEVSKSRGSGRVGSGQDRFIISRVGWDHDPRDTGRSRVEPS